MNALRILVAVLVTAVWVAVYTASVLNPNFHAPPEVSGIMLAIVTYLFGKSLRESFTNSVRDRARQLADRMPQDESSTSDPEA